MAWCQHTEFTCIVFCFPSSVCAIQGGWWGLGSFSMYVVKYKEGLTFRSCELEYGERMVRRLKKSINKQTKYARDSRLISSWCLWVTRVVDLHPDDEHWPPPQPSPPQAYNPRGSPRTLGAHRSIYTMPNMRADGYIYSFRGQQNKRQSYMPLRKMHWPYISPNCTSISEPRKFLRFPSLWSSNGW